jgi:hypothetical protein
MSLFSWVCSLWSKPLEKDPPPPALLLRTVAQDLEQRGSRTDIRCEVYAKRADTEIRRIWIGEWPTVELAKKNVARARALALQCPMNIMLQRRTEGRLDGQFETESLRIHQMGYLIWEIQLRFPKIVRIELAEPWTFSPVRERVHLFELGRLDLEAIQRIHAQMLELREGTAAEVA